jgi:hypothetical protein
MHYNNLKMRHAHLMGFSVRKGGTEFIRVFMGREENGRKMRKPEMHRKKLLRGKS